jgi:hypothetical protein
MMMINQEVKISMSLDNLVSTAGKCKTHAHVEEKHALLGEQSA